MSSEKEKIIPGMIICLPTIKTAGVMTSSCPSSGGGFVEESISEPSASRITY